MGQTKIWVETRENLRRFTTFIRRGLWQVTGEDLQVHRKRLYQFLRILVLVAEGTYRNRIFTHAASLSFSSLIGLGPLLAIAVMISGFAMRDTETDVVAQGLDRLIQFVAPPSAQFERLEADSAGDEIDDTLTINPQLLSVIDQIIASSQSGAVGAVGVIVLVIISIQLLTSIEGSFNTIWGVRRGRSVVQRLIVYWSLITLGALAAFTIISMRLAMTVGDFVDGLPWIGALLSGLGLSVSSLFTFVTFALLLGLFFRFIPNTNVNWMPALAGGAVVSVLLHLNNMLSFIYIERVILTQSLYGSIGILPILLFGLWVFWIFILFGGQLTYVIQNVDVLTAQTAWDNASSYTRETVTLSSLLHVARNFHNCIPPPSADELARALKVPVRMINQSLLQLEDMGMVSAIESEDPNGTHIRRFQPGRPLNRLYPVSIRREISRFGNNTGAELTVEVDPLLKHFLEGSPGKPAEAVDEPSLEALLDSEGDPPPQPQPKQPG